MFSSRFRQAQSVLCTLLCLALPGSILAADLAPDDELFDSQEIAALRRTTVSGTGHHVADIRQQGHANRLDAYQIGSANRISLAQQGELNQAQLYQLGSYNAILLTQDGVANRAGVVQVGNENLAQVYQSGVNNLAVIQQTGSHLNVSISQTGNNSVARVTQQN